MTTLAPPPPVDHALGRILAPLPPLAEPVSLWADGTYAAIREALREEDPRIPQGIWVTERKKADPAHAAELALAALETRAKDVYVGTWLLEAWTRMHGFAGTAGGLRLMADLCRQGWDALHPTPSADEPDARERAWEHLSAQLVAVLRAVPLVHPAEGPAVAWNDVEAAAHRERHGGARDAGEVPTSEEIAEAAERTPPHVLAAVVAQLGEVRDAIHELWTLLRHHGGGSAPSAEAARRTVEEIRAWVASHLPEPAGSPAAAAHAEPVAAALDHPDDLPHLQGDGGEGDAEAPAATPFAPTPAGRGAIGSRAEAYAMLDAAAGYLERAEPHSPVPALVRRAIAWGRMDLSALLAELTLEGYDLQSLRSLLGMARDERR